MRKTGFACLTRDRLSVSRAEKIERGMERERREREREFIRKERE